MILAVQNETGHVNPNGTAWYAYCDGELLVDDYPISTSVSYQETVRSFAKQDGAPLGCEFDNDPVEVPSILSKATGLRRYWVASAI